jgi:hypothetical protein
MNKMTIISLSPAWRHFCRAKVSKRYCRSALDGDPQLFSILESEQKSWSEEYALDVLADQLRPQADEAFRQRNYAKSAELYTRIRDRLSPAEIKKLSIAAERCKD